LQDYVQAFTDDGCVVNLSDLVAADDNKIGAMF
jgi:hypothetical protein